jgi:hypothetical protein
MFLGPVNLRATRKEVQLKVKEEYNSYRVCVKVYYSWYYRCQVVFFFFWNEDVYACAGGTNRFRVLGFGWLVDLTMLGTILCLWLAQRLY